MRVSGGVFHRAPRRAGRELRGDIRLTTSKPMSDIPPAPPKSPILIIVLLAVVGAVLAAIGYIWAYL